MSTCFKILILFTIVFVAPDLLSQTTLEIEISNIRSDKGTILISIFSKAEQFPRKAEAPFKDIPVSKKDLKEGVVIYKLNKLTPGQYAVALLDDENNSGEMEYRGVGIPTEGFGFSNNIKPLLSCPPYRKCLFDVKEGKNKISIKLRYK